MQEIKAYFSILKEEFIADNPYRPFISSLKKDSSTLQKLKIYLSDRLSKNSKDIDAICTMASVHSIIDDEAEYILEQFLKNNDENISSKDKARIYTNLAFYHEYSEQSLDYLLKAEAEFSPYYETYYGLALYYFNEYQYNEDKKYLEKSLIYFDKASKINDDYIIKFGYAVALYEIEKYDEAKKSFEALLNIYPDRMKLLLALAYCHLHLGNKKEALSYLSKVKDGPDEKYNLLSDDIAEYEVYDAYYTLDEFDIFLENVKKIIANYYTIEWEHLFYTLWKKEDKALFDKICKDSLLYFDNNIEEIKNDIDISEEEKETDIAYIREEKQKFENMIERVKTTKEKPKIKLSLSPEFNCFLIDCVIHKL